MEVIGFDAGERIDKCAMVVMAIEGDYKAPVPQDVNIFPLPEPAIHLSYKALQCL